MLDVRVPHGVKRRLDMTIKKIAAGLLGAVLALNMTGCAVLDELLAEDESGTSSGVAKTEGGGGGLFGKDPEVISKEKLTELIISGAQENQETIHIDGTVNSDDVDSIINVLTWDHPELFWISGYDMSYNDYEADITLGIIDDYTMDDVIRMSGELEGQVAALADKASVYDTDYEKALYVHDAIINSTEYDSENAKHNEGAHLWGTAYGTLVQHKSVCQGYSEAYKMVMNRLGIECGVCGGMAKDESHAWNYIKLDGKYYWADLTWDDPFLNGESGYLTHVYFLFDDSLLYPTRTIDSETPYVPTCSSMDMNYYVLNGCYFDHYDFDEIDHAASETVQDNTIEFMFSDEAALEEAYSALIEDGDVWEISEFSDGYGAVYPIEYEDMHVLSLTYGAAE